MKGVVDIVGMELDTLASTIGRVDTTQITVKSCIRERSRRTSAQIERGRSAQFLFSPYTIT